MAQTRGMLRIEASAIERSRELEATPGTGSLVVEASIDLGGHLIVDTPVASFDGPLPGFEGLSISVAGNESFDPFALDPDSAVTLRAPIMAATLPGIPLGTVPGHLELEVLDSSVVEVGFRGLCVSATGGEAHYDARSSLGGTIDLSGRIVLDLPPPLGQTIEIPRMQVPLPARDLEVAFEPVGVAPGLQWHDGMCPDLEQTGSGGQVDAGTESTSAGPTADEGTSGASQSTQGGATDSGSGDPAEVTGAQDDDSSQPIDVDAAEASIVVDGVDWDDPVLFLAVEGDGRAVVQFESPDGRFLQVGVSQRTTDPSVACSRAGHNVILELEGPTTFGPPEDQPCRIAVLSLPPEDDFDVTFDGRMFPRNSGPDELPRDVFIHATVPRELFPYWE